MIFGQLPRGGGRIGNPVHHESCSGSVDEIENIVQRRRQLMDIFAVEGSDERLVEFGQDGVRKFIAVTFNAADAFDLLLHVAVVGKEIDQGLRPGNQVVGHCGEHREKTGVFRDETHHGAVAGSKRFWR